MMLNRLRFTYIGTSIFALLIAFPFPAHGQAVISSISPNQGPIAGGTSVTLSGSGFIGATLTFGDVAIMPQSESATQIVFITPAHDSGIVNAVLSGNGARAYAQFLYVPPPLGSLPPGYITTVMGIGHYRGDGTIATQAMVDGGAMGMAIGQDGSVFFSEPNQNIIRRVRPDGIVEAIAGTGNSCCNLGDGGPALDAMLGHPRGLALDGSGNIYFADSIYTNAIRRIDASTGIITTIAGGVTAGYAGDGGPASQAELNDPLQVAFDGVGNLYILDWGNVRIRKIDAQGNITTIAGNGTIGFAGDGGPATLASFNVGGDDGGGLAADAGGNVYLADDGNGRVRKIDGQTGIITTFVNGLGPVDAVATDSAGQVYIGCNNYASPLGRILKYSPSGQLLQAWGSGQGFSPDGSAAASAAMGYIQRIGIAANGDILFAEYDSNRIRRIDLGTGLLQTVAGMGPHILNETGGAITTPLNDPGTGLAFAPDGGLLTAEGYNLRDREMSPAGAMSDVAGNGFISWDNFPASSPALDTHLYPTGIAAAPDGDIDIVNMDGAPLVRVNPQGMLYAVVPNHGFSGDGGPAGSAAINPGQYSQVAVDAQGNVFIADSGNNRIRRIDAGTGVITTVAGNGTASDCGDGGPAIQACLDDPVGVAVGNDGSIYIGENSGANNRIRKVDPQGAISTLATLNSGIGQLSVNAANNVFAAPYRIEPNGHVYQLTSESGDPGGLGDGGPAGAAKVNTGGIAGIAVNAEGDLFFSDDAHRRIRAIHYGAVIAEPGSSVIASAGSTQSAPEGSAFAAALQVTVNSPAGNLENGIRVDFSAPASGPSCTFPDGNNTYSALTGLNGVAAAVCAANAQTGSYAVSATPLALGLPVNFSLTNTAAPIVNMTPGAIVFPAQTIGTTGPAQAVMVANGGGASLAFNAGAVTISGLNAADFTLAADACSSQTLPPNGACSVQVTFKASITGSETAALSFADNAANSPQTLSLSGTGTAPPGFTLGMAAGSSSSAAITPGETANYLLSVTPLGGLNQTVSFTCAGAPALANCTLSSASVTLNGAAAQTVTVSVSTTKAGATPALPRQPGTPPWWRWPGMMLSLLALLLWRAPQWRLSRRKLGGCPARPRFDVGMNPLAPNPGRAGAFLPLCALAVMLCLAGLTTACGGGSNSSVSPLSPGTPAGTYTLTVTGTAGSLTQAVSLTLTVN